PEASRSLAAGACAASSGTKKIRSNDRERNFINRQVSYRTEFVFPETRPSQNLRNHLDGSAVEQGLVFRRQGHRIPFGKAGSDLDTSQILQGKLDGLALQVVAEDAVDVGLGLIDAQGVALKGEDVAVFGNHNGDANVDVGQKPEIFIVKGASGLANISGDAQLHR